MRRFRLALISLALLVPLAAPTPAAAASRQKGQEKKSHDAKAPKNDGGHAKAQPSGDGDIHWREQHDAWRDRDHCVVVVRQYYSRPDLPPGLAKKKSLPPGLQKQLRERGHLPPGLEKHWVMLPAPLERDLPPLPPHHARRIVGGDLLVIDLRLNIVVSLWKGVL